MAPKNQPSRKGLQGWVRFGLRHLFTEDDVDPMNAPALAQLKERLRANFHSYADDPEGLEAEIDRTAAELREAFCEKNPRLRVRYAKAIKPLETTEH